MAVAVVDLDLVVASAALDYVGVVGVSVGEHEVVAALHDYLVVDPVVLALVDSVVYSGCCTDGKACMRTSSGMIAIPPTAWRPFI